MTIRPLTFALTALLSSTTILLPLSGHADTATAPATNAKPATGSGSNPGPNAAAATPNEAAGIKADAGKTEAGKTDPEKTGSATAAAPSRADMRARWMADREAFFSARLAALHAGLQLTPAQQGLWSPVETAIRDVVSVRREHWHRMREESDDISPIDRLTERGEHLEKMGAALKALAAATGPLLGALTPEQKGRLPRLLEGFKPRRVMASAFELREDRMDEGWMRRDTYRMGRADRDGADRDDGDQRGGMPMRGMEQGGSGQGQMDRDGMRRGGMDQDTRGRAERGGVYFDQAGGDGSDNGRHEMNGGDGDGGMPWHHHHHDDEDGGNG